MEKFLGKFISRIFHPANFSHREFFTPRIFHFANFSLRELFNREFFNREFFTYEFFSPLRLKTPWFKPKLGVCFVKKNQR